MKATTSILSIIAVMILTATLAPRPATAAELVTKVRYVLISADETYGGCMIGLADNPATVVPGCGGWWVSFSCSGDYTDPVRAYRMLDQAQLAWATGKRVKIIFDDSKLHGLYCFASRIDLLP